MNRSDEIFLDTADFLGAKLCREAIWSGSRCNWVGAAAMESTGRARGPAYRACGPDLFGGTSGIAIFLGRLFVATGEKIFRLTAEGAIRQALSRLDDFPPETRIGFYTGLTGIAYVLVELAQSLDVAKFAAMGLLILEEVGSDDTVPYSSDVISGSAGAVPTLLTIHRKHPKDFLLDLAVRQGEHLLDAGKKIYDDGTSDRRLGPHGPAGFAQGGDGVAWALLELYHVTGNDNFLCGAKQLFLGARASRAKLDDESALRAATEASGTWFHGTAGIGLTRLRAFELLGEDVCLDEARTALRRTSETLSRFSSETAQEDFSLAHGATGEAELLLCASRLLNDESHKAVAERLGRSGIERYGNDLPWPCGAPGRAETPNLMLGLAGIGYFYLRLHDILQTPSLLMVMPDHNIS